MQEIIIGKKTISADSPVFIIAEAGVNHNGNFDMAKQLTKEAALCGADCIKFQTFKAERVVTKKAPKARYQLGTTDAAESQLAMLKKIELKPEEHRELKEYAEQLGLVFLSTPYNFEDIDLLESVGVSAYKIASGQIIELPFLRRIAETGKPVFLSTGMATMAEIDEALREIFRTGNDRVILLQCTTNYPSKVEDANLRVIGTLEAAFGTLTGYSDHTVGDVAPVAAVAAGARVIEKHFTLDKGLPGPDHSSSMTPGELTSLVEKIRAAEAALGSPHKSPAEAELQNAPGMRRSIVASCKIHQGEILSEQNITFKRPATGLSPGFYDSVIGRKASRDIDEDEPLQMDMILW